MSPTLRAQLWELGRTTWPDLMFRLALSLLYMIFFYCLTYFMGMQILEIRGYALMAFLINAIPAVAHANALVSTSGFSIRLGFTRPISTWQLVIVPILFSVALALVCFLISGSLFFWLLGISLPIAGPSVLVACLVCCFIACMWSFATVLGRWIGVAAMGTMYAYFVLAVDRRSEDTLPHLVAMGGMEYWEFPWYVYLGLALSTATATAFTVFAVERQRHGDSIGLAIPFTTAASRNLSRVSIVNRTRDLKPFRNQWTAQCWYDFQSIRKWLLFPVFFVPVAIVAFVGVANHFDPSPKETFYALAGSLVVCPMVYQLVGAVAPLLAGTPAAQRLGDRYGACSLPAFNVTRPMRSDHLVAIKLLLVAGWSLVGCLLIAVAAFLYLRFIGDASTVTKVGESLAALVNEVSIYWWMVGAVSGLLLLISTASMFLAYVYWIHILFQPRVFLLAGAFTSFSILLFAIDILSDWPFHFLWITYGYLFSVVIIVLCMFGLRKSLSSRLLSKPYFVVTLSMWAVFVCTTVAFAIKVSPATPASAPMIAYVIAAAMLLIPLAAITALPLGLAVQRHG